MKEEILWIARDKNGQLFLFEVKPHIEDQDTWYCDDYSNYWQIPEELYPEVTFENSPRRLIIK